VSVRSVIDIPNELRRGIGGMNIEDFTEAEKLMDLAADHIDALTSQVKAGGAQFDADECYQLFIAMDDRARAIGGQRPEVNALREKLLPFYRDWHAKNPHAVHPSALSRPAPEAREKEGEGNAD
jgi:hypothetical protein